MSRSHVLSCFHGHHVTMTPTPLAPMQGRGGPVQRGLGGREASLWSIGAAESARMPPGRHWRKKPSGQPRLRVRFLPLKLPNSIFFRQIAFRLIGHLTLVNIAPEPRGFGQENSHSRDFLKKPAFLALFGNHRFNTNVNF